MKERLYQKGRYVAGILLLIMIVGGACIFYSLYPTMTKHAISIGGNYFDSYNFFNMIDESISYLNLELIDSKALTSYKAEYGKDLIFDSEGTLDYYAKNNVTEKKVERDSDLLQQVLDGEVDLNDKSVVDAYQFIVFLSFDEDGNVMVKEIYDADLQLFQDRFTYEVNYLKEYEEVLVTDTDVILGIARELPREGTIFWNQLSFYDSEFFVLTMLYMGIAVVIILFVIFFVPFSWFEQLSFVRTILLVPLELRLGLVILTIFGCLGAYLLVIGTYSGQLLELIQLVLTDNFALLIQIGINLLGWAMFMLVMIVHALYIKEFFVIGPWQTLRRHTLLGKFIAWRKRPKVITKTVVEEKEVQIEDPRMNIMMTQLSLLQDELLMVKDHLKEVENLDDIARRLELILDLCQLNEPKRQVNFTKLLADTLVQSEDKLQVFELKTTFSNEPLEVSCQELTTKTMLEQFISAIIANSLPNSRLYLELVEEKDSLKLISRSIIISDDLDEQVLKAVEALAIKQQGSLETIIDGDLMKLTLRLKK